MLPKMKVMDLGTSRILAGWDSQYTATFSDEYEGPEHFY